MRSSGGTDSSTRWCPSCGDEFVIGTERCPDCRVALVDERPEPGDDGPGEGLVELGTWSRLAAQVLRRRLEAAGVSVMIDWTGPTAGSEGTVLVPDSQADFADAVVRELPVEDELRTGSAEATLEEIETRVAELASLLEELRTQVEGGAGT